MKYLTTREEMQNIDAYSIQEIGIPGLVLMEKAALSMEEEIIKRVKTDSSFLIVVERGNNGGDGLALGRLLQARGYKVDLYEIGGVPKASDSYLTQRNILENLGVILYDTLPQKSYDVIVDGIFGVGLKREVKGIQAEVIEKLNKMSAYRIAIDVPSGVDASDGKILGTAFDADLTITFGLGKRGLILYPGAARCGEICIKDIGFPMKAVDHISPEAYTYDAEDLARIPARKPWSNKGNYGKVLMVAGTKGMAGAAYLSSHAAYACGSGLVRIFTCEENRSILQNQLPEAIFTSYDREISNSSQNIINQNLLNIEETALACLKEVLPWASVIGFGPGLGGGTLPEKMLSLILEEGKAPLVVDADGINALARMLHKDKTIWEKVMAYPYGMIFTPHLMEMSRLCDKSIPEIQANLIETARSMADDKHIIVLKDARTVVADGSSKVYINTSGNDGMSVGGSGDVLTGMICGLLAGGATLSEAARLGVYCHGLAGDAAARKVGHYAMLARDLIEGIAEVIR